MTLEITDHNWPLVRLYWNAKSAYEDIIAGVEDDENSKIIVSHRDEALNILYDWVWASSYRSVRYILGVEVYGHRIFTQLAQKRQYSSVAMARIALAAEINSLLQWNQETQQAKKLIQNPTVAAKVFEVTQAIVEYLYLEKNSELCSKCQTISDYVNYYRITYPIVTFTSGVAGVLKAMVNLKDNDIVRNIAAIHDAAKLLDEASKRPGLSNYSDQDWANNLKMHTGEKEIKAAKEILMVDDKGNPMVDDKGNPIPMRWTLSGGTWPDNRTPNEDHPSVKYARKRKMPVQMGPSRTTATMLTLAEQALNAQNTKKEDEKKNLLAYLDLGLFAWWNQAYNRRCTMIHCYHFVTDCAVCNFDVESALIDKILNEEMRVL